MPSCSPRVLKPGLSAKMPESSRLGGLSTVALNCGTHPVSVGGPLQVTVRPIAASLVIQLLTATTLLFLTRSVRTFAKQCVIVSLLKCNFRDSNQE
jgi:hypothetical protein